jgi:hypothetical protein
MGPKPIKIKGEASWGLYLSSFSLLTYLVAFALVPRFFKATPLETLYSLLFFLSSSYFLGYTLSKGVFSCEDYLELHLMRMGFGLCALPVLFVLMETTTVPLRWYYVLGLALIRPAFDLANGLDVELAELIPKRPRIDVYSGAALTLSALAFLVAILGSFAYPYLEDGDPWEHAAGVKYISLYGTYTQPAGVQVAHYIKPYPPSYDTVLGLIHQLNSSVSWTLKTFNSLLVSLSYIFAFFMVRRLSGSSKTALFSCIILFCLPPFGSHTIWAHTMSAMAVFVVFYSMDYVRQNKAWAILAAILLAGSLVIQPLMSAVMGLFFAFFSLARTYTNRKEFGRLAIVGVFAIILSMVYWAPLWFDSRRSDLLDVSKDLSAGNTRLGVADKYNLPTALQIFFPAPRGDIFMQQGFGIFAVLLAFLAIDHIIRTDPAQSLKRNPWLIAISLWFVFSLLALLSGSFSLSIYPTRFWGIVAIPMAILGGFMLERISQWRISNKRLTRYIVPTILLGLIATSAYPKMMVQLSPGWPTDLNALIGPEFDAYLLLRDLPANTPVYTFCTKDAFSIGFDKMSYPWDPDVTSSRKDPVNINPKQLNTLLKSKGYKWAIFDFNCIKRCTDELNKTKGDCSNTFAKTLQALDDSRLFTKRWPTPDIAGKPATMIFKVE